MKTQGEIEELREASRAAMVEAARRGDKRELDISSAVYLMTCWTLERYNSRDEETWGALTVKNYLERYRKL